MSAFPYWALPIFSAFIWLAMLLALLVTWLLDGSPRYVTMNKNQRIAYISDIGAAKLKPLFITMSAVAVVALDLAFLAERWLRHCGRLVNNTSTAQKSLSICSSIAAVVGAAGIILLSIFDTKNYPRLHNVFLSLFIGGYIISAIFICAAYQRLGIYYREHRILRISFWIKLAFILVEVALAIAFGVCQRKGQFNISAVVEWIIALVFTFYVASFFLDFIPAASTTNQQTSETTIQMAEDEEQQQRCGGPGERYYARSANGHPPAGGTASSLGENIKDGFR